MDGSYKQTINFQKLGAFKGTNCVSSDLTTKVGVTKPNLFISCVSASISFQGEKFDMTNLVGFPHFNGQSYLFVVWGVATLHDHMMDMVRPFSWYKIAILSYGAQISSS